MSAKARVFIDTNVLVYLLSPDERKAGIAAELLTAPRTTRLISTQVLGEFVQTVRRKIGLDWSEVRNYVDVLQESCFVAPIGSEDLDLAFAIAESRGFQWYDSLIVAAAIRADAQVLYTEDLQDRQRIDALTIINPFRSGAAAGR